MATTNTADAITAPTSTLDHPIRQRIVFLGKIEDVVDLDDVVGQIERALHVKRTSAVRPVVEIYQSVAGVLFALMESAEVALALTYSKLFIHNRPYFAQIIRPFEKKREDQEWERLSVFGWDSTLADFKQECAALYYFGQGPVDYTVINSRSTGERIIVLDFKTGWEAAATRVFLQGHNIGRGDGSSLFVKHAKAFDKKPKQSGGGGDGAQVKHRMECEKCRSVPTWGLESFKSKRWCSKHAPRWAIDLSAITVA